MLSALVIAQNPHRNVAGVDTGSDWATIASMEGDPADHSSLPKQRRAAALLAQLRPQTAGGILEDLQRIAMAGAATANVSANARLLGTEAAMHLLAQSVLRQDPPQSPQTWLWKMAHSQALTAARHELPLPVSEKSIPDAEWFAERPELVGQLQPGLQRAIEAYTAHRTLHAAAHATAKDRSDLRRALQKAATLLKLMRLLSPA